MKYRIAYAIACTVDWIDNVVFDHGLRFERVPFVWKLPTCQWSALLHEWAAEMCCDIGCERCS